MDALNKNSKAAGEEKPKARFRTRDISVRKLYSNDKNFYSMHDIDKLAQDILMCGMMENLTVTYAPCERGEYRIIAGERRWRALQMLLEKGYTEFEVATCQIKTPTEEHEETVQIIMANAYRDKTAADIVEEEKRLKASLQYMKENRIPLQGYSLESGRLRDVIASIMQTTATKIAQIESINNRLIPEFADELKEGKLTFSAAYELSGMQQDAQKEMLARYKAGGLTWKEVKEAKAAAEEEKRQQDAQERAQEADDGQQAENLPSGQEKAAGGQQDGQQDAQEGGSRPGDGYEQAHPEGITSLCYSCTEYETCNVKTGTCTKCDQYRNRAEAYKTDEQRYNEEQAAIDRETKKKLREQEDRQREQEAADAAAAGSAEKYMRVSDEMLKNVKTGRIPYMIVKEGAQPYRQGDLITLIAFSEGKATGEQFRVCVTVVDNAETSSGIVEGYAVIGVMDIYDAEQLGLVDLGDMD